LSNFTNGRKKKKKIVISKKKKKKQLSVVRWIVLLCVRMVASINDRTVSDIVCSTRRAHRAIRRATSANTATKPL
jgi:hypothetical protein